MKRLLIGIVIANAVLVALFFAAKVQADPAEQQTRVTCPSIKKVFSELEKVDAALRINRGRVYNDSQELLLAMNARLTINKKPTLHLVRISDDFARHLQQFRDDYNEYDDKLSELLKTDCNQPVQFYKQIVHTRAKRIKLQQDIDSLDSLLKQYSKQLKDNLDKDKTPKSVHTKD